MKRPIGVLVVGIFLILSGLALMLHRDAFDLIFGVFSLALGIGLIRGSDNCRQIVLVLCWFNLIGAGILIPIFVIGDMIHHTPSFPAHYWISIALSLSILVIMVRYLRSPETKNYFMKRKAA